MECAPTPMMGVAWVSRCALVGRVGAGMSWVAGVSMRLGLPSCSVRAVAQAGHGAAGGLPASSPWLRAPPCWKSGSWAPHPSCCGSLPGASASAAAVPGGEEL